MIIRKCLVHLLAVPVTAATLVLHTGAAQGQAIPNSNANHGGNAKRALTAADAIEMTQSGDDSYLRSDRSGNAAFFSPDRSRFAFFTQKDDLKRDVVTYSIWVFNTASVLKSPQAQLVASLDSSSNRPAVSQLKWLPDNETLVFLGEETGETPQIYKVNCNRKKLEKLTNEPTPITQFSMTDRGDAFVYLAGAKQEPLFSDEQRRRGFFVPSGDQWYNLYLNRKDPDYRLGVYFKTAEMRSPERIGVIQEADWFTDLSISPDGAYAVARAFNTAPPNAWNAYQVKLSAPGLISQSACLAGEITQCPHQFWLLDARRKTIEPLLDSPNVITGQQSLAAWTTANTVLLVNALLPLDSATPEERSRRERNAYVAEVTLPERKLQVIDEREKLLPAFSIELDKENGRLFTRPVAKTDGNPFEFRKLDGRWKITELSASTAEPTLPLSVTLDEGINTPPKLVATDPKTKERVVLLDLNPQFAQLTFGHVEIFHWKNQKGIPAAGDLYYPANYVSGKRYPLVIQTHGESRERFLIDGFSTTADAAQALVNKDFFVLQMGSADPQDKLAMEEMAKAEANPQEAPFFVSLVESAIDELDRRGLIHRDRVGITGFSRTVYHVEYLLTHSNYPFGATVIADGVDMGYGWCVIYPFFHSFCEKMNGGLPWGESLTNWEKESPPMRLDKVHASVLLQSISGPIGEWEVYAGLRWLKKPVELVNFYPEGAHELVRPQQKLLSHQSAVDWYCFWLKGEEDSDAAKTGQYTRWREMRSREGGIETRASQP